MEKNCDFNGDKNQGQNQNTKRTNVYSYWKFWAVKAPFNLVSNPKALDFTLFGTKMELSQ